MISNSDALEHAFTLELVSLLQRWMNGYVNYELRHDTRQAIQSLQQTVATPDVYFSASTECCPAIQDRC